MTSSDIDSPWYFISTRILSKLLAYVTFSAHCYPCKLHNIHHPEQVCSAHALSSLLKGNMSFYVAHHYGRTS